MGGAGGGDVETLPFPVVELSCDIGTRPDELWGNKERLEGWRGRGKGVKGVGLRVSGRMMVDRRPCSNVTEYGWVEGVGGVGGWGRGCQERVSRGEKCG